jgi:hypothetical protein
MATSDSSPTDTETEQTNTEDESSNNWLFALELQLE